MGLFDGIGEKTAAQAVSDAHQAADEAIERIATDIEQPALDRIEAISKRWEAIAAQFHQDITQLIGLLQSGIRFGDPK